MTETLLKCTTRHVRIFTARVENNDLVHDLEQLTLDLDPDNEFLGAKRSLKKYSNASKNWFPPMRVLN